MSEKNYQVAELARLSNVTVRALHHYDTIGLLAPSGRTQAGYRLYDEADLLRLQQILIHRELGMPLEQIKRSLDDPGFDQRTALVQQREHLRERARTTASMIRSVDAALAALKGDNTMDLATIFDGFDPKEHEEETRARWGESDAYKVSARRTKSYTAEDWQRIKDADQEILDALAEKLRGGAAADDADVLALADRHRLHIDRWFYPCSHAMHAGLAEMYVSDQRFEASFEKRQEGLARFLAEAVRTNAKNN